MPVITASRLAMYRGIIALAWADHQLTPEETEGVQALITNNPRLSAEQKQQLLTEIKTPMRLESVWPNITEAQDRAHLLDIAMNVFGHDGEIAAQEKETYEAFLAKHLKTLDVAGMMRDMNSLLAQQAQTREQDERMLDAYRAEFGLLSRLKRVFGADK